MRQLCFLRKFSTSRTFCQSILSADYRSKELWNERFKCSHLEPDRNTLTYISNKVISGQLLSNVELDIFINIASPRTDDTSQLEDSARSLRIFRKSLFSQYLLPSSSHAVCRLFLYSDQLKSLVSLLDNRVEFGVFPDFFVMNLLLNEAIDREDYALATKLSSLVMVQEEFGCNKITDKLTLLSISKYVESKPNFEDWPDTSIEKNPIIKATKVSEVTTQDQVKPKEGEEEEEEEDAEYKRIPFLRNPYFDNHFDIKNPRVICGKTLEMVCQALDKSSGQIPQGYVTLAYVLQGRWDDAISSIQEFSESLQGLGIDVKNLLEFFSNNLTDAEPPGNDQLLTLSSFIEKLPSGGQSAVEFAMSNLKDLTQIEATDTLNFKDDLVLWSNLRTEHVQRRKEKEARLQLIAEMKAKKEELQSREEYLYFYDKLIKSKLTRINYD